MRRLAVWPQYIQRLQLLGALHRDVKILVLSMFLWEIGLTLYDPILPVYLRQLEAQPGQLGLVYFAAYLVMALASLPGGWLADRFERRKVMVFFWWLGAPSVLVLAAAQVWWQAIPGLSLYFLSFMAFPAINAYLTHAAEPSRLSFAFGLLYATFPVAQLIGPGLGGFLAELLGMRIVLLVSFGFYLISTLVIMRISPQPVSPTQPSAATWQAQIEQVFRNRSFLWFLPAGFTVYLFFTIMFRFTSPFLAEVRGYSLAAIGLLSSLTALGGIVLLPVFSTLGDQFDRRRILGLASGLVVLAMGLIAGSEKPLILGLAFLLLGGIIVSRALMDAEVGNFGRAQQTGLYFGIFGLTTGLAQSIAPLIGGRLYERNPTQAFWLTGLLGLALMFLLIFKRRFNEQ